MILVKLLFALVLGYFWSGFTLFFACWITGSFNLDFAGRSIRWRLHMFAIFMGAWPLGVWDYLREKAGVR